MQISDFISGIALIISAVAIYFCWTNNKQNQRLASAQKKTELLQKMDKEIFKLKDIETLFEEIQLLHKGDEEYQDFIIKHLKGTTLKTVHNTIKQLQEIEDKNKKCIKEISETRELFAEIDINLNPVLFEKRLQHANRQLLSAERLVSGTEKLKKNIRDAKDQVLEFKEKMLNNKKSDE